MWSAVLLAISLPVIAAVLRVAWFVGSLAWRTYAHQRAVRAFPALHGGVWRFFREFRSDKVETLLEDVFALGINHPVAYIGASFGGYPYISISDPELFSVIFNEHERFIKSPMLMDLLRPLTGNGLVASSGELWHSQRRLLTPLFHLGALHRYESVMQTEARNVVVALLAHRRGCCMSLFKRFALRVVVRTAFGAHINPEDLEPAWEKFNRSFSSYAVPVIWFGDIAHRLRFLFHGVRDLHDSCDEARSIVRAAMERRIREAEEATAAAAKANGVAGGGDALGAPRAATPAAGADYDNDGGNDGDDAQSSAAANGVEYDDMLAQMIVAGVPPSLIVDECMTFLFAGFDTTSIALSYTMVHLARNPHIMQKLAETADAGDESYARDVFRESLRLTPPVSFNDRRVTGGPVTWHGLTIPEGSTLQLNWGAVHRRHDLWGDDAALFVPERWTRADVVAKRHAYAWVPFNAGPRNCIGQRFAMREAVATLMEIGRRMRVRFAGKDNVTIDNRFLVEPKNVDLLYEPRA